jgi:glyoxylase-like metal-dependent hydrolase (beta-lactamase superfamily II)
VLGKITVTRSGGVKVHTYTAPEEGWLVNSHLIELPTQLLAVDAQYMLPFAREVVDYGVSLGKPVTRLYITHYHPDHLLGAAVFRAPIYALAEVQAKIETVGDRLAGEEHEKHGAAIPFKAERPSELVTQGEETIDGIRVEFLHLQHAETENALMIGLPDQGILITQDLLYAQVHVFVAERAFDTWVQALGSYQAQSYTRLLPGHGSPGGQELYDSMLDYLAKARDALAVAHNGADLKARLIAAFPNFGGRVLLDHQQRFLFPPKKAKTEEPRKNGRLKPLKTQHDRSKNAFD